VADPDQAAADLIALAMDGGAPDNITCIVADVEQVTAQPASAGTQV
jgi:serine/threonine protein phosphatase PrpC